MTPDSNEQDMRWRHVLKPTEIPWLLGHCLQNQVVFPAAGHVITALEKATAMCKQKRVVASLLELFEVEFGRALVFEGDDSNVEVVISLADIVPRGSDLMKSQLQIPCSGRQSRQLTESHGQCSSSHLPWGSL